MTSLATRAAVSLEKSSFLANAWLRQQENPYNERKNPDGIVNLGTSENKLVFDVVSEKYSELNLRDIPEEYLHYCDFRGLMDLREAIAKFMTRYMKSITPVNPANLTVLSGVGAVVEALAFTLFDEGDGILIPAPYYGSFFTDLSMRANTLPLPVYLSSKPCPEYGETAPFELSIQRIEKAYTENVNKGINVRGLLLTNPNNPLGSVYSERFLRQCMDFCYKRKMHVIFDEVYLFSHFGEGAINTSITALSLGNIPDPARTHVLWGYSKDFGMAGFRCGVVHSWNEDLHQVLNKSSYFASVPTVTQFAVQPFVTDFDWLDKKYLPLLQKRLREVHAYARNEFKSRGIYCLPAESGFFVWADFRKFLKSQTTEAEQELFEKFMEAKVYLSPSQAFYSNEPGWFRLIITMDMNILREGLNRLFGVLLNQCCIDNGVEKEEALENLVQRFQNQVQCSDWLAENTAEKWKKENPELARQFLEERDRCIAENCH